MRILFILLLLTTINLFGQSHKIKVKRESLDSASIIGTWYNTHNKTKNDKNYTAFNCNDTIQYLQNGKYLIKSCGGRETGSWKMSSDGKSIILYEQLNPTLQNNLKTLNLGEIWITELGSDYFVSYVLTQDLGRIKRFYYRIQ